MMIFRQLRRMQSYLKPLLTNLNLFGNKSQNPAEIYHQVLSTRVFLILFVSSVSTVMIYSATSLQTRTVVVQRPTLATFQILHDKYDSMLKCPCQNMSVPYGLFVKTEPSFHQVCSSEFVTLKWINYTFPSNRRTNDFITLYAHQNGMWQAIAGLCRHSMNAVTQALISFNNSQFFSATVVSESALRIKSENDLSDMIQSTGDNLGRLMNILHEYMKANAYVNGWMTNARFNVFNAKYPYQTFVPLSVKAISGSTDPCVCHFQDTCLIPARYIDSGETDFSIYFANTSAVINQGDLPGLMIDCLPVTSTLLSTLECFFNQGCINHIFSNFQDTIEITPLNESPSSRFLLDSTVEELVNNLFLENIANQSSFSAYYDSCSPAYCTYTYFGRLNWIYIMSTIVSLIGGISIALRFITPRMISAFFFLIRKITKQSSVEERSSSQTRFTLSGVFQNMKTALIELNIFDQATSSSPHEIRSHRTATRLYIALMTLSIMILTVYTSASTFTISETIEYPSQEKYEALQKKYTDTLHCPCTVMSIPQRSFTSISTTYHQLCSSDYINSSWYEIRNASPFQFTAMDRFFFLTSSYFRTLRSLCETAQTTMKKAVDQFLSKSLIAAQILPRKNLINQINASIDSFRETTLKQFLYLTSSVSDILNSNEYISVFMTNTQVTMHSGNASINSANLTVSSYYVDQSNGKRYYCVRDSFTETHLLTTNFLTLISKVPYGCSLLDIALRTTLSCWYDELCTRNFQYVTRYDPGGVIPSIITLDYEKPSRYWPHLLSLEPVYMNMMLEEFNSLISYDTFYNICIPSYCTYTYTEQANLMVISTVLLGLFGGLNVALRLLTRFLVRAVFTCQGINPNTAWRPTEYRRNQWRQLKASLIAFNRFADGSEEIHIVKQQRIFTRLYILLLLLSITILTIYTATIVTQITKKIDTPSLDEYKDLFDHYPASLRCPCRFLSTDSSLFITVNVKLHQVCSSAFIGPEWIDFLFDDVDWNKYLRADFRVRGGAYFRFLSKLCASMNSTIQALAQQFFSAAFINLAAISEKEFVSRMNTLQILFQDSASHQFANQLQLVRDISQANGFVSSYLLNWIAPYSIGSVFKYIIMSPVIVNNECSCGTRIDCVEQGGFFNSSSSQQSIYLVPGWNVGCSVVETVLRSTLECFYDRNCIASILNYFGNSQMNAAYVQAMNISTNSRYSPQATIQDIVNGLFVEQWHFNISYNNFYQQCSPAYCLYEISESSNIAYIVSRILSLYGGLTVSLRFIIPNAMKIIFKVKLRFKKDAVHPFK